MQKNKSRKQINLGSYCITLLETGRFALDGGAMYGVVPRALWEKLTPPDAEHRVSLALNCLLIENGQEKILFETGIGNKFSEKYRNLYGIEPLPDNSDKLGIEYALNQAGISPDEITRVYFSHLHFDHAGGATYRNRDNEIIPTFQNAQYFVHEGEWVSAECPHERCKASYLKENFTPLKEAGRLTLLRDDSTEILPGLTLHVTGGHTPYHQVLILDVSEKNHSPGGFIFWADLIPTRHHIKIPYVMGFDEYPIQTMEAKKALLKEAAAKKWLCIFEHEIEHPICFIQPSDKADSYRLEPFEAVASSV